MVDAILHITRMHNKLVIIIFQRVYGEIFEIDAGKLGLLDFLEAHSILYHRDTLGVRIVEDRDGNPIDPEKERTEICLTYFLRNYKPELLLLQHLSEYSDEGKKRKAKAPDSACRAEFYERLFDQVLIKP